MTSTGAVIIHQPTLMIYGDRDMVAKSENLSDFVPNVEVVNLDSGHLIQQEVPGGTTAVTLNWMERTGTE